MKSMILVALALVAVAVAVPVEQTVPQIVRSNYEQQPEGSYSFGFEADNGIVRQEEGLVKQALDEDNKPHDVVVVRGSYSYPNEFGELETINYSADENGYHAEGKSIPTAASR